MRAMMGVLSVGGRHQHRLPPPTAPLIDQRGGSCRFPAATHDDSNARFVAEVEWNVEAAHSPLRLSEKLRLDLAGILILCAATRTGHVIWIMIVWISSLGFAPEPV